MMRIRQNRLIATDDKVDSEIRLVEERVKGVRRIVVSGDARGTCKNKPPYRRAGNTRDENGSTADLVGECSKKRTAEESKKGKRGKQKCNHKRRSAE